MNIFEFIKMSDSEVQEMRIKIAKLNNVSPRDIMIAVNKDGSYYSWCWSLPYVYPYVLKNKSFDSVCKKINFSYENT